jgi:hypothetical protein
MEVGIFKNNEKIFKNKESECRLSHGVKDIT